MKFGLTMFITDYSIGPGALARAAEDRGFDSLWVPEHSHFPVSPMTPGRNEPGLPNMYYEVVDPFVALAMAAETTETLLLGTSICLVVHVSQRYVRSGCNKLRPHDSERDEIANCAAVVFRFKLRKSAPKICDRAKA